MKPHNGMLHSVMSRRGRVRIGRRRLRGTVLVVITVVILLASLTGYGMLMMAQAEHKAARASAYQVQAAAVVQSGCEYLASLLERPRADLRELGGLHHNPELLRNVSMGETGGKESFGGFTFVGPPRDPTDQSPHFGVENESAKLHLEKLIAWDQEQPGAGRIALTQLPGMTDAIADAILDWVDADDTPRPAGAESDYYRSLERPLVPRNGIPENLEELLLVRDVTRDLLFGRDRDRNYLPDDNPLDFGNESGRGAKRMSFGTSTTDSFVPWSRFLTVVSAERNETAAGEPRIRLNQPDLVQLHQALVRVFPPEWADFIVAFRQFGPASDSADDDNRQLRIDFDVAPAHNILSPLDLIDVTVSMTDSAGRQSVMESPFRDDPPSVENDLPRLLDAVSVDDVDTTTGRVNIGLAPREVLMGIPAIDEELVERILASRQLRSLENGERRNVSWLLNERLVILDEMRSLLANITDGGDVVRAQLLAFVHDASLVHRVEIVVDASVVPARRVYYNDLRPLGRGFPDEWIRGESGELVRQR